MEHAPEAPSPQRMSRRGWTLAMVALAAVTLMVAAWNLQGGAISDYYAAVTRSMGMSWRNFLFGALDPAGTFAIDKIPGSLWIMAIVARVFGYSNVALGATDVIATAATVVVVACMARRWLGDRGGLLAGVLFAATPIVGAVARSNQPHVLFVLFLVLAADRAIVALRTGARRSLIAAGLWIAVAFHSYMLEAWMLWPALIVAWLVAAPVPMGRRVRDLLIAGVVSGAASLTWIVITTLVPASARPWIGGTNGNSAWEMVFGYNGIGRFGQAAPPGALADGATTSRGFAAPFGGEPGVLRLLNDYLAGQIAWLLPAAIVGIGVVWAIARSQRKVSGEGLFLALWLAIYATAFSVSQGIHPFYTAAMAPAMVTLAAAALHPPVDDAPWRRGVVEGTLAYTAVWAFILTTRLGRGFDWTPWAQAGLAAVVIIAGRRAVAPIVARALPVITALALSLTPMAWTVAASASDMFGSVNPVSTPSGSVPDIVLGGKPGGQPGPGGLPAADELAPAWVIDYTRERVRDDARYLFAAFGSTQATIYIRVHGISVLPIGGFDGQDPWPTVAELERLIATGDVRFVRLDWVRTLGSNTRQVRLWVDRNCITVKGVPDDTLVDCAPD